MGEEPAPAAPEVPGAGQSGAAAPAAFEGARRTPPTAFRQIRGRWSGLAGGGAPLPHNVHLVTLMRADEEDTSRAIIRLAHMFQIGEDEALSAPAKINLGRLLSRRVLRVMELSLTAARRRDQMPPHLDWPLVEPLGAAEEDPQPRPRAGGRREAGGRGPAGAAAYQAAAWGDAAATEAAAVEEERSGPGSDGGRPGSYDVWSHPGDDPAALTYVLYPMEIRTFELDFSD